VSALASASAPLIIDLHGGGGSAAEHAGRDWRGAANPWAAIADAEGAVVVWADGIDGMWNSEGSAATADSKFNQDDVGFLRSAIASTLAANPTIDSGRIYMTGFSLGCYMAHGFAVEASDLVAAVACSAGTLAIPTAPAGYQPTSVMHIHGNQDSVIPYSTDTVESFAEFNGCESSATVTPHTDLGYNRHQYSDCNNNVEVALIELLGGGHDPISQGPTVQIAWQFISRFANDAGGDAADGDADEDAATTSSTTTTTTSAEPSCVDDGSWRMGKKGRRATRGCAWVADSRTTARKCKQARVRAACPYTCAQC